MCSGVALSEVLWCSRWSHALYSGNPCLPQLVPATGRRCWSLAPCLRAPLGSGKKDKMMLRRDSPCYFLITSHFTSLLICFFLVRVHALSVTFSFWIFPASVQADAGDGAHRAGCVTLVPSEFHHGETVQGGILENIMAWVMCPTQQKRNGQNAVVEKYLL